MIKDTNHNEILTERNMKKKTIIKNKPTNHNSNNKCIICFEKVSNAVLMNCGHGGICF